MTHQQLALAYLRHFCAADIDALAPLFAPKLQVSGPLLQCQSAAAYLAALRQGPPEPAGLEVLSITGDETTVAVHYQYQKSQHTLNITQQFFFQAQKIARMVLDFDKGAVARKG